MSVLRKIIVFALILEQGWNGNSQPFSWLPMGRFGFLFLQPFPSSTAPPTPATNKPHTLAESIGRPIKDTLIDANTDVAAQEAAILSAIRSCSPVMSTAKLGCPCGHSGKTCADPLSVCNLENHCVCDGRVGHANAGGSGCVAYVIPTTTRTSTTTTTTTSTTTTTTTSTTTTTFTTTTTPTTTTTLFTTTPTTTPTSTTTTTPTTTPPLYFSCSGGTNNQAPSPPLIYVSPGYTGGNFFRHPLFFRCMTSFAGQPGKQLQFRVVDFQVQVNGQPPSGSGTCPGPNSPGITVTNTASGSSASYCPFGPGGVVGTLPPDPLTFPAGEGVTIIIPSFGGTGYKLKILVTTV